MAYDDSVDFARNVLTGDIEKPLRFTSGIEAIIQGILIRLNMVRGELFCDTSEGMPWFARQREADAPFGAGGSPVSEDEAILGQKYNPERIRRAVNDLLLATPGVSAVLSLSSTFNTTTRGVSISFSVKTIFGDSEVITTELGVGAA